MRDEAEAADVDVLMGYNKVSRGDDENRTVMIFSLIDIRGGKYHRLLTNEAMLSLTERVQVCSQDARICRNSPRIACDFCFQQCLRVSSQVAMLAFVHHVNLCVVLSFYITLDATLYFKQKHSGIPRRMLRTQCRGHAQEHGHPRTCPTRILLRCYRREYCQRHRRQGVL